MNRFIILLLIISAISCKKDDKDEPIPVAPSEEATYFPAIDSDEWDTVSAESLGWNLTEAEELKDFMELNDTRAFIILKNGKIVMEEYWGDNIIGSAPFDANTNWYWASAGKTLTALLVGIAQEDGLLNIDQKTSDYLGNDWSSLSTEQQDLITIKHQLTMTTGLDYEVDDIDCTDPECLLYNEDAGSQWYYHNAPYTLLEQVVSNAADLDYNLFTDQNIETQIGMDGFWAPIGFNNVYWSSARDAARFGILMLNKGTWGDQPILADTSYFHAMTNSSQDLNPSYGYLTWLNGKSSIVLPGFNFGFNIPLSEAAPSDLYAAIGKNGQIIDVVPSQNLVVIRMGDNPDNSLVPTVFHNEMWEKINAVIN